jgi:hypothetical protein
MSETSELFQLAEDLVNGSRRTIHRHKQIAFSSFEDAQRRKPSQIEVQVMDRLFPDPIYSAWDVGPFGVTARINERGDQAIVPLGEFIAGIAVANNIDPTQRQIETVIFHTGALMGKME